MGAGDNPVGRVVMAGTDGVIWTLGVRACVRMRACRCGCKRWQVRPAANGARGAGLADGDLDEGDRNRRCRVQPEEHRRGEVVPADAANSLEGKRGGGEEKISRGREGGRE